MTDVHRPTRAECQTRAKETENQSRSCLHGIATYCWLVDFRRSVENSHLQALHKADHINADSIKRFMLRPTKPSPGLRIVFRHSAVSFTMPTGCSFTRRFKEFPWVDIGPREEPTIKAADRTQMLATANCASVERRSANVFILLAAAEANNDDVCLLPVWVKTTAWNHLTFLFAVWKSYTIYLTTEFYESSQQPQMIVSFWTKNYTRN